LAISLQSTTNHSIVPSYKGGKESPDNVEHRAI